MKTLKSNLDRPAPRCRERRHEVPDAAPAEPSSSLSPASVRLGDFATQPSARCQEGSEPRGRAGRIEPLYQLLSLEIQSHAQKASLAPHQEGSQGAHDRLHVAVSRDWDWTESPLVEECTQPHENRTTHSNSCSSARSNGPTPNTKGHRDLPRLRAC